MGKPLEKEIAKDFNNLRLIAKKLVKTPFQQSWQYRVQITGQPEDFDIYVKDITYGPIEIETEAEKAGHTTITWPSGTAPVSISMTMRDHEDQRVRNFIAKLAAKVTNPDGTVNLPIDYLVDWQRFSLLSDNTEKETDSWKVYPTQLGDVTEAREEPGFLEFPVTLIQFRT